MDWLDIGMYTMMVLVAVAIVCLIAYGVFWAVNYWFQPIQHVDGSIENTRLESAHTNFVLVGKVMVPQHIPDRWHLGIHIPQGSDDFVIEHAPFDWQRDGSRVLVEYQRGRLTGAINVRAISPR